MDQSIVAAVAHWLGTRARWAASWVLLAAAAAWCVGAVGLVSVSARAGIPGPQTVRDDEGDWVPCEEKTAGKVTGPSGFDLSELVVQDDANGNVVMIIRSRGNLSDTVRDLHGLLDTRIDLASDGRYYRLLRGFSPEGQAISEVRDPQGALLPDELLVPRESNTGGAVMRVPPSLGRQMGPNSRVGVAVSYRDGASGQLVCDFVALDPSGKPTSLLSGAAAVTTTPGPVSTASPEENTKRATEEDDGVSWWWVTLPGLIALGLLLWRLLRTGPHGAPPTLPPSQTDFPPDTPTGGTHGARYQQEVLLDDGSSRPPTEPPQEHGVAIQELLEPPGTPAEPPSEEPQVEAPAGPQPASEPQFDVPAEVVQEAERDRETKALLRMLAEAWGEAAREAKVLAPPPSPTRPLDVDEQREIETTIIEDGWAHTPLCEMSDRALERLMETLEQELRILESELLEEAEKLEQLERLLPPELSDPEDTSLVAPSPEKERYEEQWREFDWCERQIKRVRKQLQLVHQKLAQRDYGA